MLFKCPKYYGANAKTHREMIETLMAHKKLMLMYICWLMFVMYYL